MADHVTPGAVAADVGTDHGRLPIALVHAGRCPRALAFDIAPGPLAYARRHVQEGAPFSPGLAERVTLRLGPGLAPLLAGEAEVVTVCGMGGQTMAQLLEAHPPAALGVRRLVLQPNGRGVDVRLALSALGYTITEELFVVEGRHFYLVMAADLLDSAAPLDEVDARLGPILRRRRGPLFEAWLAQRARWWAARLSGAGDHASAEERRWAGLIESARDRPV